MVKKRKRIAIALQIDHPYPHHQEVLAGVLRYASEQGWESVIDEHPGLKLSRKSGPHAAYDGVIARVDATMARRLKRLGIPYVNTWIQHAKQGQPGVYIDSKAEGRIAAEHLLQRGFCRLSCEHITYRSGVRDAARAFKQTAEAAGAHCTFHESIFVDHSNPAEWRRLLRNFNDWLDTLIPPVGLFVVSATDAHTLINLCRERGWRVPLDVAILCHRDSISQTLLPRVSYMDLNYTRNGYESAALLERLMDGEPVPDGPIIIPPRGVVSRETTDYFAVADKSVSRALRYISDRLGEALSLNRIADAVGISPRLLQMRFDAALGRSVSDEIRRLRLEVAKRLLMDPRLTIAQVAKQSGFGANNQLSRVFRRELGVSPSGYRERVSLIHGDATPDVKN